MFASTAVDPTQPLDPDTARDGEIFNIWTLDLVNGELRQLTDTATGNVNPVLLAPDEDGERDRIGFISYFKSEYGVHTIELEDPLYTAATSDFGGPGPIIDFQAPLTHTLNPGNVRRKGRFENMFMEGRPPINFGVTNSGDLLGGTAITFADVLGDQLLSLQAYSIDTYRTFGGTYANRSSRMQFALQGFSTEQFFYGLYPGSFYGGFGFLRREDAIATRRMRGGNVFGIYPFDRFRRVELSAGVFNSRESFNNPDLRAQSNAFQLREFGTTLFQDGTYMPLGVRYVQGDDGAPGVRTGFGQHGDGGLHLRPGRRRPAVAPDRRPRRALLPPPRRVGRAGVSRPRLPELGRVPRLHVLRRQLRDARLRLPGVSRPQVVLRERGAPLPLIEAMLTPIGVLGGIRGTFFFNFGVAGIAGQPMRAWTTDPVTVRPVVDYVGDPDTQSVRAVFGDPVTVSGLPARQRARLVRHRPHDLRHRLPRSTSTGRG